MTDRPYILIGKARGVLCILGIILLKRHNLLFIFLLSSLFLSSCSTVILHAEKSNDRFPANAANCFDLSHDLVVGKKIKNVAPINNLQQILSLLRLQANRVKLDEAAKILRDSQNRVLSIALIHEQLFKTENLSEIDLAAYIDSLVKKIYKAFDSHFMHVDFELKSEKIILDINRAMACGIIINELLTNSFNYAFPEDFKAPKKISINLEKLHENNIKMCISDNGIGLPKDFDIFSTKTLGLQLAVSIVEKQLFGKIRIEKNYGTKFIINFKANQVDEDA